VLRHHWNLVGGNGPGQETVEPFDPFAAAGAEHELPHARCRDHSHQHRHVPRLPTEEVLEPSQLLKFGLSRQTSFIRFVQRDRDPDLDP
jgi:hypothetical protein